MSMSVDSHQIEMKIIKSPGDIGLDDLIAFAVCSHAIWESFSLVESSPLVDVFVTIANGAKKKGENPVEKSLPKEEGISLPFRIGLGDQIIPAIRMSFVTPRAFWE